jgi:beta-phosphoglucomutase-like phosphatase (HAD superfamily)
VLDEGEEALFTAYGRTFQPEHKRRLLGASGEAPGRILASVLDQPGRELARELLDFCWDEVVEGAEPRPGAVEFVEELRGTVPIGIASNSPRALVEAALDGKMLFGIKVVREDTGEVPGIKAAAIRTVLRIVDGLFSYLAAFVAVLASHKNQRLGDIAAHTLVVCK